MRKVYPNSILPHVLQHDFALVKRVLARVSEPQLKDLQVPTNQIETERFNSFQD